MTVYIFNLLVNYFPCGVDNAQAYRAGMLDAICGSVRDVYTKLPTARELNYYERIGIPINEMICAHQYFTDNHSLRAGGRVDVKLEKLRGSLHYTDIRYENDRINLLKNSRIIASIALCGEHKEYFHRILYFKEAKLIRTEVYTDGLLYAEYYMTAVSEGRPYAKLTRRTFFNRNGSVAYDQIFDENKEWYLFPDGRCCTKSEFLAEFVKKLNLTEKNVVLLDRFSQFDFVQPLFRFGNRARFIAVVHSGHYFEKNETPNRLYLNSDYFYLFKYARFVDKIVVSTQEQKKEFMEKQREHGQRVSEIEVIPAGGISRLRYPETGRKPYSLLAVSRLDTDKRVDWIIKAVIKAHRENPEVSLTIYGNGKPAYIQELQCLAIENDAQQYIRFMGYADVTEVYKDYEVFLSSSLLETLGLSVMEAVGSGMAAIGLNVKYGNRLFIHPGENGYLVDADPENVGDGERQIEDMAGKIVEIFRDRERLEVFHRRSYEIAGEFLSSKIQEKWKRLLREGDEYVENLFGDNEGSAL